MSLREGCRAILTTDCVTLLERMHRDQRRGMYVDESAEDATSRRLLFQEQGKSNVNLVFFFCGHSFVESSLRGAGNAAFCPICQNAQGRRMHGERKDSLYGGGRK